MKTSKVSLMRLLTISVAMLGATLASGRAAAMIDVNFNNMTAGQQVATGAPPATLGGTLQTATTITVPTGSTATIVNGFKSTNSPNTAFGQGNALVIDRQSASSGTIVSFDAAPVNLINSGIVSFKFDFMIDNRSVPSRSGNFFIGLRNSSYTTVSSFQVGNNGALTLVGYTSPGSAGSTSSTSLGTLSLATAYTIELRLNYSTGMAQTYINGVETGISQAFATTGGIMGVSFSTASNTTGQWGIDNLSVTAIPEPSVTALLSGIGLLGFSVLRRRQNAV